MKLRKKHIAGIYVAVVLAITGTIIYFARASLSSTPEQQHYLPKLLADTQKIVISQHPEIGGAVLSSIDSKDDIKRFIKAIELKQVTHPCICLGFINIQFISSAAVTNTLNYKAKTFIKFDNSWNIQGIPSKEFDKLMQKYTK